MRSWLAVASLSSPLLVALFALAACKSPPDDAPAPPLGSAQPLPSSLPEPDVEPVASAARAFEKTLQVSKLRPPAQRAHEPGLAFGKGVFGQLTADALRVFDAKDFRLLASEPLEAPRALLALADGALLAIGGRSMLRWEAGKKRAVTLPRPTLLPGAELYPDAQVADLLWVFDASGPARSGSAPTLSSYRLAAGTGGVLLPEQTIELASPRGGVLGTTREGVWLYFSEGHAERLGPSGARLAGVKVSGVAPLSPVWVLPARRLDQSLWLDEAGQVARVLVSPSVKRLSGAALAGSVVSADVGDEGRLLAAVVVTGEGPRFELQLLDGELAQLGRVVLPAEAPTGTEDWVKVVTANQHVVAAPREPRTAVGGPERVTIFDAQAKPIFSIPSR